MTRVLRLSDRWESVARGNRRALLLAEADLRREFGGAAARALDEVLIAAAGGALDRAQGRRVALAGVRGAAQGLQARIASATLTGRRAARTAAQGRLARELREVARELRLAPLTPPPPADAAQDEALALAAGAAFAAPWSAGLTAAVLRWSRVGGELVPALRAAAAAHQHRLDRLAATEVPKAYSEEHSEGAGWVAQLHRDATWLPLVARRWDAANDRKTCAVCREMDGALAPLGGTFRGGLLPGEPHPHCRCQDTLIVLPVHLRERVPGRQVDDERPREAA